MYVQIREATAHHHPCMFNVGTSSSHRYRASISTQRLPAGEREPILRGAVVQTRQPTNDTPGPNQHNLALTVSVYGYYGYIYRPGSWRIGPLVRIVNKNINPRRLARADVTVPLSDKDQNPNRVSENSINMYNRQNKKTTYCRNNQQDISLLKH